MWKTLGPSSRGAAIISHSPLQHLSGTAMTIGPGTRLGPYSVVAAIGSGGMGQVYRAHDQRLGRDVAIKVLPPEVASDPDRLRRFEQEARAAAALNHSNILALYDIGSRARGVLHRHRTARRSDVARAARPGTAGHRPGDRSRRPRSPAVSRPRTAAISSTATSSLKTSSLPPTDRRRFSTSVSPKLSTPPPRLRRQRARPPRRIRCSAPPATWPRSRCGDNPIDHRADIFAFGSVLYEMLTGRRAFTGDTALDTMSAILREAPASDRLDAERPLPPSLLRIVDRCLEKSPGARFQSTTDLAFALKNVSQSDALSAQFQTAPLPAPARALGWRELLLLTLGTMLVISLFTSGSSGVARQSSAGRGSCALRSDRRQEPNSSRSLSRLGRRSLLTASSSVFQAVRDGNRSLWLRHLRSTDARPLGITVDLGSAVVLVSRRPITRILERQEAAASRSVDECGADDLRVRCV